MQEIVINSIEPDHSALPLIIKAAIGNPTNEKIQQVLEDYRLKNNYLIGSFLQNQLVGVIGIEIIEAKATIKHISVIEKYRAQGIGRKLVNYIITHFSTKTLVAETDDKAVGFYKSLGFSCNVFDNSHSKRYKCKLNKN